MTSASARPLILLVDDSPIVRAVVAHALESVGMRVEAIDDPRGIAAAVAGAPPDVLLVDATFPATSDDDLVALVLPHAEAVPVLLFSDRKASDLDGLAARMKARAVLPKDGATLAQLLRPFLPA